MHKILIFDIDGTLAPLNGGMHPEDMEKLRRLESAGYTIAVCSGKCCSYVAGFVRQLDLMHPILMGEQGAVIQFGLAWPPERFYVQPYSERAKEQLKLLRERIDECCGDRNWYQPNLVELTPFFRDKETAEEIQRILNEHPEDLSEVTVFRYSDCYDFLPKGLNKAASLRWLTELTGIGAEEYIAVGDYLNDIPMFEFADQSILIGGKLDIETDYKFETIGEALEYLLERKL